MLSRLLVVRFFLYDEQIMLSRKKQKTRFTVPFVILFFASLALGACSSNTVAPPISEISDRAPIERTGTTEDVTNQASTSAATVELLAQANTSLEANDQATAITYLERAIRITPRNPELWTQLAHAHLLDGNLSVAEQHARKAIALSSSDETLEQQAWLTFADVREAQGNRTEAQGIRRRFSRFRG